ncbi:MAG: 3-deoxy-manno-octulosonate cytidylyltransferase [Elusimicrobia bacterium]|nr:3-deoxy-manno-octulosonate cytidylyltransferase [Elusimicrobiota bacterium]
MTPPPLLSDHAKRGKLAKQISSAEMPNCDKRGGGVKKNCLIVIPARYHSQRFPGKVLEKIKGKPVLQWCYEAALKSGLGDVVIATEDKKVLDFTSSIRAKAILTSKDLESGTDRVFAAAKHTAHKFIINLQGDEPFMQAATLRKAFDKLLAHTDSDIATACSIITDKKEINNPNCVKIAMNKKGQALYFSRSPIPFHHSLSKLSKKEPYYKHCGFYIYRKTALKKFISLPPSNLEKLERLEQLRALENGMKIVVVEVKTFGPAIDVPSDIKRAETYFKLNKGN